MTTAGTELDPERRATDGTDGTDGTPALAVTSALGLGSLVFRATTRRARRLGVLGDY